MRCLLRIQIVEAADPYKVSATPFTHRGWRTVGDARPYKASTSRKIEGKNIRSLLPQWLFAMFS